MQIVPVPNFLPGKRHGAKPRAWQGIVLHWTAGTGGAQAAVDYTGRASSGGWYHYIVEMGRALMCLDPARVRAAHAGSPWNGSYIGVASAQPIYPGRTVSGSYTLDRYRARIEEVCATWRAKGYDIRVVPYASRNCPLVLTLDRQHASELVDLCARLCEQHGIPRRVYLTARPSALAGERPAGVVFHHQISRNGKWDCIPWLDTFREAFGAEGFELID